jgi:hypothetical protein
MTLHRVSPNVYAGPHVYSDGTQRYVIEITGQFVPLQEAAAFRCDFDGVKYGEPVAGGWGASAYSDCVESLRSFVENQPQVKA